MHLLHKFNNTKVTLKKYVLMAYKYLETLIKLLKQLIIVMLSYKHSYNSSTIYRTLSHLQNKIKKYTIHMWILKSRLQLMNCYRQNLALQLIV